MYGSAYPSYFGNDRRSKIMKGFVTSKVISKINDNASCLPYFEYNDENLLVLIYYLFIKIRYKI